MFVVSLISISEFRTFSLSCIRMTPRTLRPWANTGHFWMEVSSRGNVAGTLRDLTPAFARSSNHFFIWRTPHPVPYILSRGNAWTKMWPLLSFRASRKWADWATFARRAFWTVSRPFVYLHSSTFSLEIWKKLRTKSDRKTLLLTFEALRISFAIALNVFLSLSASLMSTIGFPLSSRTAWSSLLLETPVRSMTLRIW